MDGDAALRARVRAARRRSFERMDELAKLMRKRRYERGSLDFDLPEPKLVLDAAGEMTGIVATAAAGQHAGDRGVHAGRQRGGGGEAGRARACPRSSASTSSPTPSGSRSSASWWPRSATGCPANLEAIRPEDFQLVLRQIEGKPEEKLVSYLLLRTMKLARYHEENLGHFGLATEMYAHFTSPIRRYPDLVVHRALRALRQRRRRRREACRERAAGDGPAPLGDGAPRRPRPSAS